MLPDEPLTGETRAPLNVLASWVAYLQKHGLREEFIFKTNEATQQATELKQAFKSGARYTPPQFKSQCQDNVLMCFSV